MPDHSLSSAATMFSPEVTMPSGSAAADAVGLYTSRMYNYYPTKRDILFAIISPVLARESSNERLIAGGEESAVTLHGNTTGTRQRLRNGPSPTTSSSP